LEARRDGWRSAARARRHRPRARGRARRRLLRPRAARARRPDPRRDRALVLRRRGERDAGGARPSAARQGGVRRPVRDRGGEPSRGARRGVRAPPGTGRDLPLLRVVHPARGPDRRGARRVADVRARRAVAAQGRARWGCGEPGARPPLRPRDRDRNARALVRAARRERALATRVQRPRERARVSTAPHGGGARYVVGIDLGTTNSAVAWAEPGRGRAVSVFPVPQLAGEGEVRARDTLASAVYLAGEHDVPPGALALPWRGDERFAVGAYARRLGARVAGRLVTSAKSWLCHGGVDRDARILPWGGAPDAPRLSPVEASSRIVEHLRDAWDAAHPGERLAEQDVVLTVPASFDEVARELTVRAAEAAGLARIRL